MNAPGQTDPGIPGVVDVQEVGRGGFAVVYRGEQTEFRRQVAVKVLTVHMDDRAQRRFVRECQVLGSLSDHPGIVTVYSAGYTTDGRPFLLMPYLPGGSYEDILRAGALPWQEVLDLGVRMADALTAAHDEGVLHRDLKPANVLRSRHGLPVLADFGIARVAGARHTTNDTGSITGSVHYLAPELIDGHEPSAASDIYALGSTLYALAAGEPAFHADTDHSIVPVLHRILTRDPDPLPDHVPAILRTVLATAMAKRPADRYPSAREMGRELQEAQRSLGEPVTPPVGRESASPAPGSSDRADPAGHAVPAAPGLRGPAVAASDPGITALPEHRAPAVPTDPRSVPQDRGGRRGGMLVAVALLVAVAVGVVVMSRGGGGGGAFVLAEPIMSHGDGGELASQEVGVLDGDYEAEGELAVGTADLYLVDLGAGTVLRARVIALEDQLDPAVGVVGPDGHLLVTNDDSGGGEFGHDALVDWYAREAGTYAVVVSPYSSEDDGGAYRVVLDVQIPEPLDGSVEGTIAVYGQGVHVVTTDGGEDLRLTGRSEDFDVLLSVLSPSGELVQDDDSAGGTDALVEVGDTEQGTYFVSATATDPTAEGSYTIQLDRR